MTFQEIYPLKGLNKKDIEQCQWYYNYITDYFNKSSQHTSNLAITNMGRLALNINPASD